MNCLEVEENRRTPDRNLVYRLFLHNDPHTKSPEAEPEARPEKMARPYGKAASKGKLVQLIMGKRASSLFVVRIVKI